VGSRTGGRDGEYEVLVSTAVVRGRPDFNGMTVEASDPLNEGLREQLRVARAEDHDDERKGDTKTAAHVSTSSGEKISSVDEERPVYIIHEMTLLSMWIMRLNQPLFTS